MPGTDTALALVWVAVGIILGFVAWQYIQSYLPAKTTA